MARIGGGVYTDLTENSAKVMERDEALISSWKYEMIC